MAKQINPDARYTHGSIGAILIKNGLAMLPGTIAISGYNIVDTYFVGQLGKVPLAAMGFTFPVIMLLGCIFHGLAIGVLTPVSQFLGGGKKENAAKIVDSGILLIMFISVICAVLGIAFSGELFQKLGAEGETLELVGEYMNIWYFGCFTAALGGMGNSVLIASGSARSAGLLMMGGMIINALLDPVMIFGLGGFPEMGIKGAALATVISQFLVFCVNFILLYKRHKLIVFAKIPFRVLRKAWGEIMRFAVPGSFSMIMMPIGSAVVTRLTAFFGDAAVAGSAAAMRLEVVAFIFPMSIGMTLVPTVGQNFGAKLYSRIKYCYKFSMWFALFFLYLMAVVYYFAAPYVAGFFSPDAEVQQIMVAAMRITAWGYAGVEIHRFSGFFYTGCGRPNFSAYLNGYRIFILLIPFSYIAYKFGSLEGIFAARLLSDIISGATGAILAYFMVKKLPGDGERMN